MKKYFHLEPRHLNGLLCWEWGLRCQNYGGNPRLLWDSQIIPEMKEICETYQEAFKVRQIQVMENFILKLKMGRPAQYT